MSGHSKWAGIKHKKAIVDAKKGANFTKIANLIAVAARSGADPETNFKLRLAVGKAREVSMPAANIERAIKKGSGQLGGAAVEEVTYEGYGPGGVAILIEAATDNRNRAASEIRSALTKHGGRLADPGSVAYLFKSRGVVTVESTDPDQAALDAIEAGAEDIEEAEDLVMVYCAPGDLEKVKTALTAAGYKVTDAETAMLPDTTVPVTDPTRATQIMKIMDTLDDLDDVVATYANFDIPDSLMEAA